MRFSIQMYQSNFVHLKSHNYKIGDSSDSEDDGFYNNILHNNSSKEMALIYGQSFSQNDALNCEPPPKNEPKPDLKRTHAHPPTIDDYNDDDDDIDDKHQKPKRSRANNNKRTKTTKQVTVAELPPPPTQPSSYSSPLLGSLEAFHEIKTSNPLLYEAMVCMSPTDMVRLACTYCHRYENMRLVEWSEAVLWQLSQISSPINFERYTWDQLFNIAKENQWSKEISKTLKDYVHRKITLPYLLNKNHAVKVRKGLLPSMAFFEVPSINYEILKQFKISSDAMLTLNNDLCKFSIKPLKKRSNPLL